MDYMTELTAIASKHDGSIEIKIAVQHGISKAMCSISCARKTKSSHCKSS